MGETPSRGQAPQLLHYRPWKGVFRSPLHAVRPIAWAGLLMIVRRRLFWAAYSLSLMVFLLFFFGLYLLVWFESQAGLGQIRVGRMSIDPEFIRQVLADRLKLDGSAATYRNYIYFQGYTVMIVLALAGSILIGDDFRHGSLPFYLSKPLGRRHYLLGKGLAVAAFINLMTTLPALVLFVEYGLIYSWDYFIHDAYLVLGILGYGAVLTISLTAILLATAAWLRRTVPLVMAWTTLFLLCRLLGLGMVDGLQADPRWRLIDLWNDTWLVGGACLQMGTDAATQPSWHEAALVLGGVTLACLSYLGLRLRAVEIVR